MGSLGMARSARRVALSFKAAGMVAVLLALSEAAHRYLRNQGGGGDLVDTSASVTPQDLARASELATRIEAARGRRWTRVIPFARAARNASLKSAESVEPEVHRRRRRPMRRTWKPLCGTAPPRCPPAWCLASS